MTDDENASHAHAHGGAGPVLSDDGTTGQVLPFGTSKRVLAHGLTSPFPYATDKVLAHGLPTAIPRRHT